ncbi:MAG TPA: hypothetical protein VGG80_10570 [Acidobacteriaceae bacterium]
MKSQRTLGWWLVNEILHLLDREEREAVRGDLAESCDSAAQALRSVLRLVVYRQSMLWAQPRPWLVLCLFVVPLGALLSFTSRSHAGLSAIYLWLVVNNANLALLRSAGFWYTVLQILPALLLPCLILGCFAWMAGVLLAGIARRTLWIHCAQICLALLCANAFALPQPHHFLAFDSNAAVHANAFYRSIFPLLFQCLCILLPGFVGTRQGTRARNLQPWLRTLLWASILICAFSLVAGISTLWWLRMWALPPLAVAAFAAVGPAGYLLTRGHVFPRRQRA